MIGGTIAPIVRAHTWTQHAPTAGTPVRLIDEEARFKRIEVRALSGNVGTVSWGNQVDQPGSLPLVLTAAEGQWIAPELFWIVGTENDDGVECIGTW